MILPAIDLLDGACVRLERGDFDRVTEFSREPAGVASAFVEAGARALHVVDLDAAREERPVHLDAVAAICAEAGVPVQVGGGIRSRADAEGWFEAGAARVIVGTAALADPDLLRDLVERFGPGRIVAAVDVRDGRVVVRGWTEDSGVARDEALERLRKVGVERVLYTDVRRDGTLTSPDLAGAREVVRAGFGTLVAGGIARLEHLEQLRDGGAEGAVVGSAFYRGTFELGDALEVAGTQAWPEPRAWPGRRAWSRPEEG